MIVIESMEQLESLEKGWVLTIGNFDGVHLGHQHLIAAAKETSKRLGARGVAVMTFDPHPATLLRPDKQPGLLTPIPMRKVLLERYGADCLIIMKDRPDLFNLSPEHFVDDFLIPTVGPRAIVEGENFYFGYGRSGDIHTLEEMGKTRGFEAVCVGSRRLTTWGEKEVMYSSTLIRNTLERGNVERVRNVLGRCYRLVGPVISGRGVGRELGYPTANLEAGSQFIPAEGVYAGRVCFEDDYERACLSNKTHRAAFSLGRAKTFVTDHPLLIEAHILGENIGEVTGKYMAMDFVKLVRTQQRFDSREQLCRQIANDLETVREILKKDRKHKAEGNG